MSSIEVSLIASNHKNKSDTGNSTLRPQRPPPPPPVPPSSQSQLSTLPNHKINTILQENSSSVTELLKEFTDSMKQNQSPLLCEFKHLFDNFNYESVREDILNRQMIECNFTTVLWRIFLHCLPRDSSQWDDMLDTNRSNYEKIVNQYKIDPYAMSDINNKDFENLNHPLSRDENSLWSQYFSDEELKVTITTDVRRTYPDISFFRNPSMIDLQLRILFTHSRHYQKTIPYRQGMHEILGVIVYRIHLESLKVNECKESNQLMKKLYDPQYLEHDAYTMFEKVIDHLRQFYSLPKNDSVKYRKPIAKNGTKQVPFQRFNDLHITPNDTVVRMNSIFERLKDHDRILHGKLEELSIEPTVYGIRWLRLLFGREIPFDSIPNLWTVIFSFDEHFGFVDYFFIALLIEVGKSIAREGSEHNCYLQSLMKHNVVTNAEPVIRKALILSGRQLKPVFEEAIVIPIRKKDEIRPYPVDNEPDNVVHTKGIQRIAIPAPSKPRLNRPIITASQSATFTEINHPMDSLKSNPSSHASMALPLQTTKSTALNAHTYSEMDLWNEKTIKQLYDENLQLQKSCAEYMHKFIDRLKRGICDLETPNEDVLHIQMTGLKQIANILEGRLSYDSDALQTLIDFESKHKTQETNNSDTSEQS